MTNPQRRITLQKISYRDLGSLGKIFANTFGEEFHPGHIKQRIRRIRQFYHLLRPLAHLSPWVKNLLNIYVIKIGGDMAGFIQLSRLNHSQLHLDYIAIKQQYRGQGLGTWVLRKLLEEVAAPQALEIALEVKADNPARRLYKQLGFSTRARILHYEKTLPSANIAVVPKTPGLRLLRDSDRPELPKLHLRSISPRLRRLIPHEPRYYNPSLLIRHLEWVKKRLMHSTKREYVVEAQGKIVALLETHSYPNVDNHIINLLHKQDHEELRPQLLKYALFALKKRYGHGKVSTTIYDDNIHKQKTLEKLGFKHTATYHLMTRPAKATMHHSIPTPLVAPAVTPHLPKPHSFTTDKTYSIPRP